MSDFGFPALALIVIVGMIGPILALRQNWHVPVVVGELLAGMVIGRTGFGWIDPFNPTLKMMADIGFALVMFVAGTHVPVRDKAMVAQLPRAALRAVVVGAVAVGLAVLLSSTFHTGHAALYAVLIASSSAALVLPVIDSLGLSGPQVLSTTAQVAIADTASIVLLPLVIDLKHAPRAAVGAIAVAALAGIIFVILHALDKAGQLDRFHDYSKQRRVAMELRISLAIAFVMAAVAVETHVSIMLAGFAMGLVVSGVGEPRRLAKQLFGFTEGFFSPLFFVWLGASLNVRELGDNPQLAILGLGLGAFAVLAHLVGRAFGQPLALGALAAAQLGVPVAAATIGEQQQSLIHGEAAALIVGALVTIVIATAGAALYASKSPAAKGDQSGTAKPPVGSGAGTAELGAEAGGVGDDDTG